MGKSVARITKPPTIPPLRAGDRLTKAEFIRRYDATPNLVKAELIRGVVYMPSISHEGHSTPHFRLNTWLGLYAALTPGVEGGDNGSVHFPSRDSMAQPDTFLRLLTESGGATTVGTDSYLVGPPELVVEVSASSASYDLHDKLDVYRTDGVKEYLVWRTEDRAIDWFVLKRKKYVPLPADANGWLKSEVFPGLWLNVPALIAMNMAKVVETAQHGIASPEHAAFVAKLQATAKRKKRQ